ncbi:Bifunctional NAD(P)H-hydrate repair enzyme Nnr [Rubripirellula obstinata]|uniref:NAD(P)H-hydrate epimerase n=1 Tax=Rubripirellula obstinata TaxID=406547 RepID=A0A5B1CM51_9BACT|nr:NAD(P)H-hydrate epimerase [Rubripirellula obstinata]KAA1262148.1 Bifunctional NAD(P)H-hydrate repair enzyme Nnr [Rubripirellula obstinata]
MNSKSLSCEQVRRVDQIAIDEYGIPGIVLMENAGRGAAEKIHGVAPPGLITILCGKGNNGGDGYVIARHLELLGRSIQIVSTCEISDLSGDAKTNAEIAARSDIPIQKVDESSRLQLILDPAATIVDGLLGTGSKPPLRGMYADLVRAANNQPCMRIALDIPTGMNADTGEAIDPTFIADHTITFVAPKTGFASPNASKHIGQVHVVSIGVPSKLLRSIG